jgi:hypothetical protein
MVNKTIKLLCQPQQPSLYEEFERDLFHTLFTTKGERLQACAPYVAMIVKLKRAQHHLMIPAKGELSFIGLSFSVNMASGNPYSYQLCDQFPMENIIDSNYKYVMSMDEDGWLVGGGCKTFDYPGKMP